MEFINQNILLIGLVVVSGVALLMPLIMRPSATAFPGRGHPADQPRRCAHPRCSRGRRIRRRALAGCGQHSRRQAGRADWRAGKVQGQTNHRLLRFRHALNKVCGELKKQGFTKLHNLAGGVDAWVGAGYPIKKGGKKK
jgi:hypothetical protein